MAPARFATVALLAIACVLMRAPARAQEVAQDATRDFANPTQAEHACLDQKERRAEADSGRLVPLAAAWRTSVLSPVFTHARRQRLNVCALP